MKGYKTHSKGLTSLNNKAFRSVEGLGKDTNKMKVIKRENGASDEIHFSLRLMNVNKDIYNRITHYLNDQFQVEIGSSSKDNNFSTVLISDIDMTDDYSRLIEALNKCSIKRERINLFISMTTEYDMSGFTMPKKVSDLFIEIGGSIDFSIIVI
ncbi:MAG: hypothetical protein ACJAUV_000507 [Flavobacteriales bacterium]|jgi:hypothetical protein